jgi:hypothetical protein
MTSRISSISKLGRGGTVVLDVEEDFFGVRASIDRSICSTVVAGVPGFSSAIVEREGDFTVSSTEAIDGAFISGVVTLTLKDPSTGAGEIGRGTLDGVAYKNCY